MRSLLLGLMLTGCFNRSLYEQRSDDLGPSGCDGVLVYQDLDADGVGGLPVASCVPGPGEVTEGGDCDDTDDRVSPRMVEIPCNGIDDDCRRSTSDRTDADLDGFDSCTDCNDGDPDVFPGAAELCNGVDDDCDSAIDDTPEDGVVAYRDVDGDGVGGEPAWVCDLPTGHTWEGGDCDDTDAEVFPGAVEDCEPIDRDCDGDPVAGTPVASLLTWYTDQDGDGLGTGEATLACVGPPDTAPVDGDCDDTDPSVQLASVWYFDGDRDGYGDAQVLDCEAPPLHVDVGGDCDDQDPARWPGAVEVPADGVDQDCDGDEACWQDLDGDGYGGALVPGALDCSGIGGDCADGDPDIHPGATEVASDGTDSNCDGEDGCFLDLDGDGWGSVAGDCQQPNGPAGDCDDQSATVHPLAPEVAGDGIDQDCDGVDVCWADGDGDGFGSGTAVPAVADCVNDPLWAVLDGDCGPADGDRFPGAAEIVGDGEDADCDGVESCYPDVDGDGYGAAPAVPVDGLLCEDGYTSMPGDCADDDPTRRPGVDEIAADGVDQDCDGLDLCFLDADEDGYGGSPVPALVCVGDLTPSDDDCDDTDPLVNPDALELPADGVDSDCDSFELCYADADDDGYGLGLVDSPNLGCLDPGEANQDGDCDDADPFAYPGAMLARAVPGTYPTIADAVDAACEEDIIVLAAGTYAEQVDAGGLILSFDGAGSEQTVIQGSLVVAGGSVEGIGVTGGQLAEGGCLRAEGPTELVDVRVTDCVGTTGGGAWLAQGSSWVRGSAIGNEAATGGGVWLAGDVTIEDVRFQDNEAPTGAAVAGSGTSTLRSLTVFANEGDTAIDLERGVLNGLIVAGNTGDGVVSAWLDGRHITSAGNGGDGLVAAGGPAIQAVILAHNTGYGLRWTGADGPTGLSGVQTWANTAGATDGQLTTVEQDPAFMLFPTSLPVEDWDLHQIAGPGSRGGHSGMHAVDAAYYDDLDLDGLFDGYEQICGLDTALDDSDVDTDGDGLLNLDEQLSGTRADREDTDFDGTDDPTELLNGTDPRQ